MKAILRVLFIIIVSCLLLACGDGNGGEKVELTGGVILFGNASPRPNFAEACSGQGQYRFIRGGADIKITSGDLVSFEGELKSGRGGESRECDFPFGGTLTLADKYNVEITAGDESVAIVCSADQVAVHARGSLGDLAFMNIRITDSGAECFIPPHLR